VANLKAGGVGLNLTAARQVVFNDLDWVPANHWQAEDRAYRIGQTGCVTVTYMIGLGTIDEFVKTVLQVKAQLVDAVIEGKAITGEMGGDVLQELQSLLGSISPQLADVPQAERGQDWVLRLLKKAAAAFEADNPQAGPGARRFKPVLSEEALAVLAKVLSGPTSTRYEIPSSSSPGKFYEIEGSGPDLVCTCPGFGYRGTCSHARKLKANLVAGLPLPPGFRVLKG
jgi:SWI/SNF-related matrix-associated actin-dependent regulator of chromatin subfamily A-like protein 1